MADDDSGDREKTKAGPLQGATAWVLGLASLVAAISLLATNSENLIAIFSASKQPPASRSGPASPAPTTWNPAEFFSFAVESSISRTLSSSAARWPSNGLSIERAMKASRQSGPNGDSPRCAAAVRPSRGLGLGRTGRRYLSLAREVVNARPGLVGTSASHEQAAANHTLLARPTAKTLNLPQLNREVATGSRPWRERPGSLQ